MIAQALRLWQVTPPLALWRIGFTLVLLVQLIVLRETSEGRFWLLSQGGEAVQGLWYLHTATKVTLVSALALLVCALVERRFDQPAVLSRHWIWRVCLLHIGALVALMSLIQTLPVGSQDLPPAQGELWRYPTTSIVFLLWQGTAVLLIAPRLLIRGMRFHTSAFVLCAMTAAVILSTGSSAVIDVLRSVVEDTTLSLSLVFYAWIGEAQPVLSLRDGAPLLAAPGFAISIGAPCAGYQGMLASAIIMAGLIALEWPNLRHGRALILGATTVAGVFALNALRIALLFHIGVSYSPQMAVEGFHSYFGTLSLLLVVGMAMLAMQHRSIRKAGYVAKHLEHLPPPNHDTNWDVEAGKLMLPIALYLSLGMLLVFYA